MVTHDVVVVGASAGGVDALVKLVSDLPDDLPVIVLIALHVPTTRTSYLPNIINRLNSLPASHAVDGEQPLPGHIYIAPPDYHLVAAQEDSTSPHLHLWHGPREHGSRPAVDPLFRSAARIYGRRVVGVVLSGALYDGSAGLRAIKRYGGITIAQDPREAEFTGMPLNAIQTAQVSHVLPVHEIAQLLEELAHEAIDGSGGVSMNQLGEPFTDEEEGKLVQASKQAFELGELENQPSMLTCPECGGVLWELTEQGELRYRCHVGHSYAPESLYAQQATDLEEALWTAIRALEERASLARRLHNRAHMNHMDPAAERYMAVAREAERSAQLIRRITELGLIYSDATEPSTAAGSPGTSEQGD